MRYERQHQPDVEPPSYHSACSTIFSGVKFPSKASKRYVYAPHRVVVQQLNQCHRSTEVSMSSSEVACSHSIKTFQPTYLPPRGDVVVVMCLLLSQSRPHRVCQRIYHIDADSDSGLGSKGTSQTKGAIDKVEESRDSQGRHTQETRAIGQGVLVGYLCFESRFYKLVLEKHYRYSNKLP